MSSCCGFRPEDSKTSAKDDDCWAAASAGEAIWWRTNRQAGRRQLRRCRDYHGLRHWPHSQQACNSFYNACYRPWARYMDGSGGHAWVFLQFAFPRGQIGTVATNRAFWGFWSVLADTLIGCEISYIWFVIRVLFFHKFHGVTRLRN